MFIPYDPNAENAPDHGLGMQLLAKRIATNDGKVAYALCTVSTDATGAVVDSTGYTSSTTTAVAVPAAPTTGVQLLDANPLRDEYFLFNDGATGMLLVGHGFAPTAAKYTYKVAAGDSSDQIRSYKGKVYGQQTTTPANVMVTEGTP